MEAGPATETSSAPLKVFLPYAVDVSGLDEWVV